jgi:hypothetical protein
VAARVRGANAEPPSWSRVRLMSRIVSMLS